MSFARHHRSAADHLHEKSVSSELGQIGTVHRDKFTVTMRGCWASRPVGVFPGKIAIGNKDPMAGGRHLVPGAEGTSRPRPCENVREPRQRRTVFSIAFFGQPSPELLVFRLIKSRRTFYAQIERGSFRGERTSGCDAQKTSGSSPRPIWRGQPPSSIVIYPRYVHDLPLPKPGLETAGKLVGCRLMR